MILLKTKKSRFTLIEIMLSMGVFLILLTLLLNFFSGTRQVWKSLRERNDSFEKARVAMDVVSDLLSTSVAGKDVPGFWVASDSCTFVTRTTRNLVSPSTATDDIGRELDNYYLVKIYAENGVLKISSQRLGSFTGTLNSGVPSFTGTVKEIIDAVGGVEFKTLVAGDVNKRCTAIEISLHLFDSKENYKLHNDMQDGSAKKDFQAAHEYVFTRVISFDDVSDPIYEVTNAQNP